jgi:hypothetical protein
MATKRKIAAPIGDETPVALPQKFCQQWVP